MNSGFPSSKRLHTTVALLFASLLFSVTGWAQSTIISDQGTQAIGNNDIGQSFTANSDGYLSSIAIAVDSPYSGATITLYQGEGTSIQLGQLTGQNLNTAASPTDFTQAVFDFSGQNILLQNGQRYTFVIDQLSQIYYSGTDTYIGGQFYFSGGFQNGFDANFKIVIQPQNNAPTDIALSSTTVNQTGGTNASVGTLSTTDPDAGDTHTYTLVTGSGSTNNNFFDIDGNTLRAKDAFTLTPGDYSIRIQTDDGTDTYQKVFTITVEHAFPNGDGTQANPYEVATAEQLSAIRHYLDKHFIQTADIDLDVAPYNTGEGWEPFNSIFTGSYDGNGHTIDNLFMDRPANTLQALFPLLHGTVTNLTVSNADITGSDNSAVLAGRSEDGILSNVTVSGSVTGTQEVGGVVGEYTSTVPVTLSDIESSVSVEGQHIVGGVFGSIGGQEVSLERVAGLGTVTGIQILGGIVGRYMADSGSMIGSYATGDITGIGFSTNAGGLAGGVEGSIQVEKSYATSDIDVSAFIGGLVGNVGLDVGETLSITKSYATGSLTGSLPGGLVSRKASTDGTVDLTDSFFDTETTGTTDAIAGGTATGGTGLPTDQMVKDATYADAGWDLATIWGVNLGLNNGYPVFRRNVDNFPPEAEDITITGEYDEEATLTGSYSYFDDENDAETTTTVQWYRADDADGTNKTAITDADTDTYTLTQADQNKYISYEITPVNAAATGAPHPSGWQGPVKPKLVITDLQEYSGTAGSTLSILGNGFDAAAGDHTVTFTPVGGKTSTSVTADAVQGQFLSVTVPAGLSKGPYRVRVKRSSDDSEATSSLLYSSINAGGGFEPVTTDLVGSDDSKSDWGDYDGDGDLDLVIAGSNATRIYRNDGNGTFVDINAGLPDLLYGAVEWGDYDGDGDLDLVLSGMETISHQYSRVYENQDGTFVNINAGLTTMNFPDVAWGDLDQDGDLDLVLVGTDTNNDPYAEIYENDNGSFSPFTTNLTGLYYGKVDLGDFDNDGDLDLVMTGMDGGTVPTSVIYRNDGDLSFTNINAGLTGLQRGDAEWGDYDNDGDLDLLITGDSKTADGNLSLIYENDNGTFTDINAGITGVSNGTASWGDIEGDGDLDLIVNGLDDDNNRVSEIFENEGANTFTNTNSNVIGTVVGSTTWADYNGDGSLDLLITGLDNNSDPVAQLYKGNTPPTVSNVAISGTASVGQDVTASYDYNDQDNDPDHSTFQWYRSDDDQGTNKTPIGGATGQAYTLTEADANTYISVEVTPNDGIADGAAIESTLQGPVQPQLRLTDLPQTHGAPGAKVTIWGVGFDATTGSHSVEFMPVDGGPATPATIDALNGNALSISVPAAVEVGHHRIRVTRNSDNSQAETAKLFSVIDRSGEFVEVPTNLPGVEAGQRSWGDYDGDGDLDLYLSGGGNGTLINDIYENEGGQFTATTAGLDAMVAGNSEWGDFDGDGDLDLLSYGLVVGSAKVTVTIFKNDKGIFSNIDANLPNIDLKEGSADWGDFDGDGDLDLVVNGSGRIDGSMNSFFTKIYVNNNGQFSDLNANLTGAKGRAQWGDYDGDGDLDLLVSGSTIYENDQGSFASVNVGLDNLHGDFSDWGDYDQDGDLDLVVSGIDGSGNNVTRIYENQGGTFSALNAGLADLNGNVSWGDYDADGDLDLVITGVDDADNPRGIIYENDDGTFVESNINIADLKSYPTNSWSDYDGDGDLDLLITGKNSAGDDKAILYSNNSAPTANNVTVSGTPEVGQQLTTNYDFVDPDGDADQSSEFQWYVAEDDQGTNAVTLQGQTSQTLTLTEEASNGYFAYQVITNDGYVNGDTLHSSWAGPVDESLRITSITPTISTNEKFTIYADGLDPVAQNNSVTFIPLDGGQNHTFTGSSLNGSGLQVDGSNTIEPGNYRVEVTRTSDNTTYRSDQIITVPRYNGPFYQPDITLPDVAGTMDWADYDGDGDMDVVINGEQGGGNTPTVIIVRNEGTNGFTTVDPAIDIAALDGDVEWGDYNQDGYPDLVVTGAANGNGETAAVYKNDQNGGFTKVDAPFNNHKSGSATWGDYDGDGDLDLFMSGEAGSFIYEYHGYDTFIQADSLPGVTKNAADWIDYNNDGHLDLFVSGVNDTESKAYTFIYENDGDGTFTQIDLPQFKIEHVSTSWLDQINDGIPDLAIMGSGAYGGEDVAEVLVNNGDGTFTPYEDDAVNLDHVPDNVDLNLSHLQNGTIDVAYDGSRGRVRLMTGATSDGTEVTRVYVLNPDTDIYESLNASFTGVQQGDAQFVDVHGDGDLEVVISGKDASGNNVFEIYEQESAVAQANGSPEYGDQIGVNVKEYGVSQINGYQFFNALDQQGDDKQPIAGSTTNHTVEYSDVGLTLTYDVEYTDDYGGNRTLTADYSEPVPMPLAGSGTEADPFQITNIQEFQLITQDLDAHYVQMNDIDASATSTWNGGNGLKIIGYDTRRWPVKFGESFTGSYDGQGHTISNLYLKNDYFRPNSVFYGLQGAIRNLKFTNAELVTEGIAQSRLAGFITVTNNGVIERVGVSGKIVGDDNTEAGTLVHLNAGTITNSYTDIEVVGAATQSIFAFNAPGGTITNTYSSSTLDGTQGTNYQGTLTNNFWDSDISGITSSDYGTGLTTAEMKDRTTYKDAGWDFDGTWFVHPSVNDGYPELSVFANDPPKAKDVQLTGTLITENGLTGSYQYTDLENDTEDGTVTKFYRSDDANGTNRTEITAVKGETYTLSDADVGKFISYEVTPHDGNLDGYAVESQRRGPVLRKQTIVLSGNETDISNRSRNTATEDSTDLGTVDQYNDQQTVTYTIKNEGDVDLELTGTTTIEISGQHPEDFTVSKQPASTTVAGRSEVTFEITFDPSDFGTRNANVVIENNDDDRTPYVFAISGVGRNTQPAITTVAEQDYQEEQNAGLVIEANDGEGETFDQPLTYSISGGVDAQWFTLSNDTLRFEHTPDYEATMDDNRDDVYEVEITVDDGGAENNTYTQSFAVTVTPINEAPEFHDPRDKEITVTENITRPIAVFMVSDPERDALTYTFMEQNDHSFFSFDADREELSFKNPPDFEAQADANGDNIYEATLVVSDGEFESEKKIIVTLENENEHPPVITSNEGAESAELTIAENSVDVQQVTAEDQDLYAQLGYSISGPDAHLFDLTVGKGKEPGRSLQFKAAPDAETPLDTDKDGIYEITITVDDGDFTDQQDLSIQVTDENEFDPVFVSATSVAIDEEQPQGTLVQTVTATDADTTAEVSYAITTNADPNGNGTSAFALDAPTGQLTVADPADLNREELASVTITLEATDGERTVTQDLTVNLNDVNEFDPVITSADGGDSAELSVDENTASVVALTATDEDAESSITFNITGGVDAGLFDISAKSDVLRFTNAPDAEAAADDDADNVYELIVEVSDGSNTDTQQLSITVNDVNEFTPVITSTQAITIDEEPAADAQIHDVVATDDDLTAQLTYTITNQPDPDGDGELAVVVDENTGALTVNDADDLDRELTASLGVDVQVSDGINTTDQTITITLSDVNEFPPVITADQAFTIAEDAANGDAVGTLDGSDQDATAVLQDWTITSGNDDGLFAIDVASGELTIGDNSTLDYETTTSYTLELTVGDGTHTSTVETVEVAITDVNDNAPVFTSANSETIDENTSAVLTAATSDADTNPTVSYSISGGSDQEQFAIDASTGALSFVTAPDYENPTDTNQDQIYEVEIAAHDGVFTTTQNVTVTVDDVNDNPPVISSPATLTIDEQPANGTEILDIEASDPDAKDNLTYSLITNPDGNGDGNNAFSINSSTGQLTVNDEADLDRERWESVEAEVKVTDGINPVTQTITVALNDVNEFAPVITSADGGDTADLSVDENITSVVALTATDEDAESSLTFSISGGADAAMFDIQAKSEALRFNNAPDAETPADDDADNVYEVTVEVSDGSNKDTQQLNIKVEDVNEFTPVVTSGNNISIDEEPSATTKIHDVVASDDDRTAQLTYTITDQPDPDGDGDLAVAIDESNGALTVNDPKDLDREQNASIDVTVQVTDGINSVDQTITINLNDVNEFAPVISSDDVTYINELQPVGTEVTTVMASDEDATASLTYQISQNIDPDGDGTDAVAINANTGKLTVQDSEDFDFGLMRELELTLAVTDGGKTTTQNLTIFLMAPPEITATVPADQEEAVSTTDDLVITYDQQLTERDLSLITLQTQNGNSADNVQASIDGRKLIISHDALLYNTWYDLTLPAGMVENQYQINNEKASVSFRTILPPPTVTQTNPAEGVSAVPIDQAITVTFSQEITLENTDAISLVDAQDNSVANVNATLDGSTLTITHAPLVNDTEHTLRIAEGVVKNTDQVDNPEFATSFTSIKKLPQVSSRRPEVDEERVATTATIHVDFDKDIQAVDLSQVRLATGETAVRDISVSLGDSSMTIEHPELENLTPYQVTIPANSVVNLDEVPNEEISWEFTTIIAPPEQVTLTSPGEEEGSVILQPTLSWEKTDRAWEYEIEVADNPDFIEPLATGSELTEREFSLDRNLDYYGTYYWRVRAHNVGGIGAWSEGGVFITKAAPPLLVFPSKEEGEISIAPELSWNTEHGEVRAQVQLSKAKDLSTIAADTLVDASQVTLENLEADQGYFWRVRINTKETTSDWSELFTFHTRPDPADVEEQDDVDVNFVFTSEQQGSPEGTTDKVEEKDYRLIGLPGSDALPLDEVFEGEYDKDWRAFFENGKEIDSFEEYHPETNRLAFKGGTGYWVLSKSLQDIKGKLKSVQTDGKDRYAIPVHPGWNIITNPYRSPVNWSDVRANNPLLRSSLYAYEGQFRQADTLKPFTGYYFYNEPFVDMDTLYIPYTEIDKRLDKAPKAMASEVEPEKLAALWVHSTFKNGRASEVRYVFPEQGEDHNFDDFHPDLDMAKQGMMIKKRETERIAYASLSNAYDPEGSERVMQIKGTVGESVRLRLRGEHMPREAALLLVNPVTHRSFLLDQHRPEVKAKITEPLMTLTTYVGDRDELLEIQENLLPQQIQLEPNYPNPFNPITTIRYSITEATNIQLEVYNVLGQRVQTLVNQTQQPGWHVAQFDGAQLASGMYIYRLRVGNKVLTKKMMLLK
ncbi:MAG: cadherin domain-containing protein [Bacteroidota bacterium]